MNSNEQTATVGPDFISFQVRNLQEAAEFYERVIGLTRIPAPNPHAAVFASGTTSFAVRDPFPGTDLDQIKQLGAGIGVWFQNDNPTDLCEKLKSKGIEIIEDPFEGPFGMTFSFRDNDGYVVTIHG